MKKLLFILLFFVTTTLYPQNPQTELVKYAESYLFVREIKPNRSPEIDSMNIAVHVPLGSSWCASFVSWVFTKNNIPNPQSGWSPNFALKPDRIWDKNIKNKLKPGDVCTFYYTNLGRVGHTGIITQVYDDYVITIEGNTGGGGINREGDGVYKKKRSLDKIYTVTRYTKIKPQK